MRIATEARPNATTGLSLLVGAFLIACADGSAIDSPTASRTGRPNSEIKDAAHSGGKKGFYFLPPVVASPATSGAFDATLSPRVLVCEWDGVSCATTTADFTTTTGSGGAVVRVDAQQYIVNWDTKTCSSGPCVLDPAKTYRIAVSVGAVELGHADVSVVSNGSGMKNVQTDDYVALVNGRTLPIKFRAEQGIVGRVAVSPAAASIVAGATQPFTAVVTDLHGVARPGVTVTWSSSSSSIATVNTTGLATGVAPGSATITAAADGERASATLGVTSAGPTGTIVVMSSRFGGSRIVIMNADGTNARLVTSFEPQDDVPVPDLSPDLSTVLFAHQRNVWKADVATGAVTQLTFDGAYTRYGKWSPNGSKIAFNSLRTGSHSIYVMNPDGSGVQQLTNDAGDEFEPMWSPDGQRIAFISDRGDPHELYVVDVATGVERQVTFNERNVNSPRWSPTSSLIAYMKDNTIWVVDVDNGQPPRQLTQPGFSESEPCFSPDGTQVAFQSTRGGNSQLWIVNVDGTNLHLFIPTPFTDGSCSWR